MLEGDPTCLDVCALSFYDLTDVYLMSTACTTLKWVEEEQRVFDKAQQNLCHQMIDDYNKLTKPISFVISITVITGLGHGSGGGPFGCGGFKCSVSMLMYYTSMHTCTSGKQRRTGFLLITTFRR